MRSIIAALLFALSVLPVWAADIRVEFQAVSPKDAAGLMAEIHADPARSKVVRIEPMSLDRLRKAMRGDRLIFPVPGAGNLTVKVDDVEESPRGTPLIRGTSDTDYRGRTAIFVNRISIGGVIYANGKIYQFTAVRNKEKVVIQAREWGENNSRNDNLNIDFSSGEYIDFASANTQSISEISEFRKKQSAPTSGYQQISVIVLITKRAYEIDPNLVGQIETELEDASYALFRSGIMANFIATAMGKLNWYDERGESLGVTLGEVPSYPTLSEYRNTNRGDLVVVYRMASSQKECGIANYAYKPGKSTSKRAFSIVGINCLNNFVTAHEFGHNLGLRHSRWDLRSTGEAGAASDQANYNYGITSTSLMKYDIMAYAKQCESRKLKCKREGIYSDPRVYFDGKNALGRSTGRKNPAVAARWLEKNIPAVAGYR